MVFPKSELISVSKRIERYQGMKAKMNVSSSSSQCSLASFPDFLLFHRGKNTPEVDSSNYSASPVFHNFLV